MSSNTGLGTNERVLWFLGGGVVAVLVGGLVLALGRNPAGPTTEADASTPPFAAGTVGGAAPDISNMTPRERFDRLFNRVMRAAESGDQATVTTFSPMAMSAYKMLDSVDADARYHAALIELHTGDIKGARTLADSILLAEPGHLFGYVVRATVARFEKDDRALKQAYADFLAHYPAETAKARPEYKEHPRALDELLKAAQAAKGERAP